MNKATLLPGGAGHWSPAEVDEPRAVLGHFHISEQTHFQTKNPHTTPSCFPPALAGCWLPQGFPGGRSSTSSPTPAGSRSLGWERQVLPGWICAAKLRRGALVPRAPRQAPAGAAGPAAHARVLALPGVPGPPAPSWDPLTPQAQKGESQRFCYMTPRASGGNEPSRAP